MVALYDLRDNSKVFIGAKVLLYDRDSSISRFSYKVLDNIA